MPYPEFPCDMVIQDRLWDKISPSGGPDGLLCPNCICARLHVLGMAAVRCYVYDEEFIAKNQRITELEAEVARLREGVSDG